MESHQAKPRRNPAATQFEQAADRVAAEIRRLEDVSEDVRRKVRDLHWSGRSAEYFREHAAYQAVRAGQNRQVLESLRVLLQRAAEQAARQKAGAPS